MTIGQARQAVTDAVARTELYRLWHAGQRMGATHPHILEMMGPRGGSPGAETLRLKLLAGTKRGRTVASIVKENATLVQPFEAAVLSVGEESGSLESALATLTTHFKSEHRLLLRVWSKLIYPLIVSLVFIITGPLPLLVQGHSRAYWFIVIPGVAAWYGLGGAVIVGLAANYARRREFVLARLARALAGGVEAGLPLDRVVTLAVQSTGHPEIIAHVRKIPVRQLGQQPVSETFKGCELIPLEMLAAMRVAEVSGDFNGSLRKLADLYDADRRS